ACREGDDGNGGERDEQASATRRHRAELIARRSRLQGPALRSRDPDPPLAESRMSSHRRPRLAAWILPSTLVLGAFGGGSARAADGDAWVPLFDGTSLQGWK